MRHTPRGSLNIIVMTMIENILPLNDRPRRPKAPTQTLMSNQQRQTRSRTQGVPWQHATAHTEGLPLPRNRRSTRGPVSRDNGMVNGFVALPRHLHAAVYGARASGGSEANKS